MPSGYIGDAALFAFRLRRWGVGRMALDLALEVALVFTVLKTYNIVRNQFGSRAVAPTVAHHNAVMVIKLEQHLGIFFEQRMQRFFLQWPDFVRFWNVFYWTAHSSNTIIALLALFFTQPLLYQRARSALLLMNCIAIVGYAGFPLMPPRLVADCGTVYGGCDSIFTFVDTMDTLGGIWSWRGSALEKVSNHYAAMPSMHFGYALWVSIALYGLLQGGRFHSRYFLVRKALVVLVACYPASVLFCILVTANHFLLDAICGAIVVAISYFIAQYTPQFGRGAAAEWGPALVWVTGPNSSVVAISCPADKGLPIFDPLSLKAASCIGAELPRCAVFASPALIMAARVSSFICASECSLMGDAIDQGSHHVTDRAVSVSHLSAVSHSVCQSVRQSCNQAVSQPVCHSRAVSLSDLSTVSGGSRSSTPVPRVMHSGIIMTNESSPLAEMQHGKLPRSDHECQGKQC